MHNLIHNIRNVWAMQINPAYYEALDDTGKGHKGCVCQSIKGLMKPYRKNNCEPKLEILES
jgi:hypothetical protein